MCDCTFNTFESQYIPIYPNHQIGLHRKRNLREKQKTLSIPFSDLRAQHIMTRATLLDEPETPGLSFLARQPCAGQHCGSLPRRLGVHPRGDFGLRESGSWSNKNKGGHQEKNLYADSKNWELSSKTSRISGKMLGFDLWKCQFNQQGLRFNQWQHWNFSSVQGDVSTKAWHLSRNSEPIDVDTDRLG